MKQGAPPATEPNRPDSAGANIPAASSGPTTATLTLQPPPTIPDYELRRRIGSGSYGDVWLARNILGQCRAVKIIYRSRFVDPRPFEREFEGIQKFEPISRSHPSQLAILHVGKNDVAGCFYYVMELAAAPTASPFPTACKSAFRSPQPWRTCMSRAWCIATSSHRTSSS